MPKICEAVNLFESHSTEGARQASLYVKVAVFRWFNSAIALTIVIGFSSTISNNDDNNLNQNVYNLIYAELFTIPLIKLVDVMGLVRKHILAPRARDQDEMNSYFIGGRCELAERYTDSTKVLFVALFYAAILPEALFLGAAALIIHFFVGRFCLLRMWRAAPDIGLTLSRLSRNYFFSVSLIVHVIASAYWWSGYPFDHICATSTNGVQSYEFCNQDFLRNFIFPPLPRFQERHASFEWMTSGQERITSLYAWTAVVISSFALVVFVKEIVVPFVQSFFKSTYEVP